MWVFISLVWGFVATAIIIALPLYESSDALLGVLFAIVGLKYQKASEGKATAEADTNEEVPAEEKKLDENPEGEDVQI